MMPYFPKQNAQNYFYKLPITGKAGLHENAFANLSFLADDRQAQHKHVPAEPAGQCSGLLPLHA